MDIKDQKLNKNLKVIGQNTKRLLDLTGQLLDFQKIGASKFELKFETVDVTALLNETIARFEPTKVYLSKIRQAYFSIFHILMDYLEYNSTISISLTGTSIASLLGSSFTVPLKAS